METLQCSQGLSGEMQFALSCGRTYIAADVYICSLIAEDCLGAASAMSITDVIILDVSKANGFDEEDDGDLMLHFQ